MRLLLTAFEPFDGTGLNSSQEAARAFLAAGTPPDLRFLVLPVRYGDDTRAVEDALATWEPEALLHLGQGGGGKVCVERLAVNVRYAGDRPEETGARAPQRLIRADGPPAYFARAPVERLAMAIEAAGVPAIVSNHAGIYLCNHVFYQSLHRAAVCGARMPIAFLHLPRLPEQSRDRAGAEWLPLEQLARAVAAAVAGLCDPA